VCSRCSAKDLGFTVRAPPSPRCRRGADLVPRRSGRPGRPARSRAPRPPPTAGNPRVAATPGMPARRRASSSFPGSSRETIPGTPPTRLVTRLSAWRATRVASAGENPARLRISKAASVVLRLPAEATLRVARRTAVEGWARSASTSNPTAASSARATVVLDVLYQHSKRLLYSGSSAVHCRVL
jgi:hypothetical protein